MAPAITPEADIIFNRTNVALAKSQRLIASWLPPRPADESVGTKTEEEREREQQEIFTPVPELLGMGAAVLKDGEVKREEMSGNDRLRKQLLGRDYVKMQAKGKREDGRAGAGVGGMGMGMGRKVRPAPVRREVDGDSEEEGGRSSLGKSKHGKRERLEEQESDPVEDSVLGAEKPAVYDLKATSKSQKRASNYLDEVLADRSQKKRKKSKKKDRSVES